VYEFLVVVTSSTIVITMGLFLKFCLIYKFQPLAFMINMIFQVVQKMMSFQLIHYPPHSETCCTGSPALAATIVASDVSLVSINAALTFAIAYVNTAIGTLTNTVSSVVQINTGDIIFGSVVANGSTNYKTFCFNCYFSLFRATGETIRVEILLIDNLN